MWNHQKNSAVKVKAEAFKLFKKAEAQKDEIGNQD